jgi:hypothetical protein
VGGVVTGRTVPPSTAHAPADLVTGASWNAGVAASVSFLTSIPMFAAISFTSVTITNATFLTSPGTFVSVPVDSTLMDTDNGHSNVTNNTRYVCQVAGWYVVSGTIAWNINGTGERYTQLALNGNPVVGSAVGMLATGYITGVPTPPVLMPLNVTDYVEVQGWQDGGSPLGTFVNGGVGSQQCSLNLWWVGHL